LTATPVALQEGASAVTNGAIAADAVVKPQVKLAAIAVPVRDFAAVVIVIAIKVFGGRVLPGVNLAVSLAAVYATVPAIGVAPGPVTLNDVPLMVVGSIALLKVTLIAFRPMGTPVTPHPGVVDTTVGATGSAAVVKVHPLLPTAWTPRELVAAVLIVMVNSVLYARLLAGVKVAT
jgi:hypothetical protein